MKQMRHYIKSLAPLALLAGLGAPSVSHMSAAVEGCDVPPSDCYDIYEVTKIAAGTISPGTGTPCYDVKYLDRIYDKLCDDAYDVGQTGCDSSYFNGYFRYQIRPCGAEDWGQVQVQGFSACNAALSGDPCVPST